MSNLVRLNELTQELEKSMAENRAIQNYLGEIKTIKKTLDDARLVYTQSSEKLEKMQIEVNKLVLETSKVLKSIGESSDKNWSKLLNQNLEHILELKKAIAKNLDELDKNIKDDFDILKKSLENEIKEFNKSQHRFETEMLGNIKKFESELDQNINSRLTELDNNQLKFEGEVLGNLNKFKNELDQNLSSRLEKHSSDIQVSIRNEGAQIQRANELYIKENSQRLEEKISRKISNLKWLFLAGLVGFSALIVLGVYLLKFI
ncbi:hypothetical protein HXX01_00260 [Candidatus Nomurabacteria bacterium]|nr:hypothetical protein [Candidatus Nomurabacteria bacterium]